MDSTCIHTWTNGFHTLYHKKRSQNHVILHMHVFFLLGFRLCGMFAASLRHSRSLSLMHAFITCKQSKWKEYRNATIKPNSRQTGRLCLLPHLFSMRATCAVATQLQAHSITTQHNTQVYFYSCTQSVWNDLTPCMCHILVEGYLQRQFICDLTCAVTPPPAPHMFQLGKLHSVPLQHSNIASSRVA